jgi:ubiquinone/menaquinone biosynthesis C-methylase UbiE
MNRYTAIAEYYDAENERHEMLRRDVPFFLRQLPKNRRLSILELCSGTGRAAIPIAQAGHEVIGIERDPQMLKISIRKRNSVGLTERHLKLLRCDVLEMNLRRRCDRIAIFFNTLLAFTTLADQDRLLQNVRRHLKPAGRFWVDIFQPDHSLLIERHQTNIEVVPFYVPQLNRTVVGSTEVRRDMSRQHMLITNHYTWYDSVGHERRERRVFEMTIIFPRELQLLVERNGFKIDKLFGDHDGGPLRAGSPRMIASCRLA